MKLSIPIFIDSAHQLPDTEDLITKKCANLHGHTYKVVVSFDGDAVRSGMVLDFSAIKTIVNKLDHRYINEIFERRGFKQPTTAENIAKYLWNEVAVAYPDLKELSVSIIEGYKGEAHSPVIVFNG